MQIYFVSRKKLYLAVIVVIAILLVVSWFYFWQQLTVPTTVEPFYQGMDNQKQIALTINVDWGQEYLDDMLTALSEKKVAATFFLTGRWAEKFPDYAKKIAAAGQEIGNHGLKHLSPNSMTLEQNIADIKAAEDSIEAVTGVKTTLFAPASGERKPQVLKAADSLGYKTILWSIDTVDWKRDKSAAQITEKVVSKAHNGAIVLMHPTEQTARALPGMITQLQDKGYKLVPVSKILPKQE